MKRFYVLALGLVAVYVASFLLYSCTHTVVWSGDKKHYTYYSQGSVFLPALHKPLLYVQYYLFSRPYVIGHHQDPDGRVSGYYYQD
jgi:hypothetical protein